MDIGNITSLAQLACAYTLILGGYSSYRVKKEDDAEEILKRAQLQITEIILKTKAPPLTGEHDRTIESFEYIDWKKTPLRLLNRHRSYATTWYFREKKKRKSRDSWRSSVLVVFGIISLAVLFFASFYPKYQIGQWLGWVLAVSMWLPPLTVMGLIWREDNQLAGQIYGNPPDRRVGPDSEPNLTEVGEGGKAKTDAGACDWPRPGHLYALTNHINREYRIFREQQWGSGKSCG